MKCIGRLARSALPIFFGFRIAYNFFDLKCFNCTFTKKFGTRKCLKLDIFEVRTRFFIPLKRNLPFEMNLRYFSPPPSPREGCADSRNRFTDILMSLMFFFRLPKKKIYDNNHNENNNTLNSSVSLF